MFNYGIGEVPSVSEVIDNKINIIINYISNIETEIQKLNEVNISLRKENEKMKSQIKNTETNKAQNELFLNHFVLRLISFDCAIHRVSLMKQVHI